MKMKTIIGTALAFTLGMGSVVAFALGDYFPPERISCGMVKGHVKCNEFNRQLLVEDVTNAEFPKGRDMVFHFASAVAYVNPRIEEASVFFTYRESTDRMLKLKSIKTTIKPDLSRGSWKKFNDDIYLCDAGYMSCPITESK